MITRPTLSILPLCLLMGVPRTDAQAPTEAAPAVDVASADPVQAQRIAALEKSLTNATLIGHFSVTGEDSGKLSPERYELGRVLYTKGNVWHIQARIKYGEHDLPIPLMLPILWAGDTPVISVDEMAIPGLGSYTARVMIYRDHYAGFWTGRDHGGHLFGVIERAKPAETKATPEK